MDHYGIILKGTNIIFIGTVLECSEIIEVLNPADWLWLEKEDLRRIEIPNRAEYERMMIKREQVKKRSK